MSRWVGGARSRGLEIDVRQPLGPPQGVLDRHLEAVLEGSGDFAVLTREIAERDLATYRSRHGGREPILVPVASGNWNRFGYVDAVAIIVNRANPISGITFRDLDAILSTTRWRGGAAITTWGQLGLKGDWADRPIAVKGGAAWGDEESARALTIRRHVLSLPDRRGRWRQTPGGGPESGVVEDVGRDPSALGFTGMGHLSPNVRALPISADRGASPVALDARSAASGSYPLLRTVDLLVVTDPSGCSSPGTIDFARFLLSEEGQSIIRDQGDFAPLPTHVRDEALRRLAAVACQRTQPQGH